MSKARLLLLALAGLAVLVVALGWLARDSWRSPGKQSEITEGREGKEAGVPPADAGTESETLVRGQVAAESSTAPSTRASARASAHELELEKALWVEGRVSLPRGTPADERAFVVARGHAFEHGPAHRAEVAADGSFRVAFHEATREGWLELEARYLFLDEEVIVDPRGTDPPRIEPRLGGILRGRVRLEAGGSVAPGELVGTAAVAVGPSPRGYWNASTLASDLTFEFDALPPESTYEIALDAPGVSSEERSDVRVRPGQVVEFELAVQRGARVSGRVVDESGVPLRQAQVSLQTSGGFPSDRSTTLSDADGTFELLGIAPGPVTLIGHAAGHENALLEIGAVSNEERREGIELVLRRGSSVAGRVRWPDGTPAPDAQVAMRAEGAGPLSPWEQGPGKEPDQLVDADGRFELLLASPGPFRVEASLARKEKVPVRSFVTGVERLEIETTSYYASAHKVPAGTEELVLVLTAGASVRGMVRDDRGTPVENFRIVARCETPMLLGRERIARSYFHSGGSFLFDGLTDNVWSLEVRSIGHIATLRPTVDTASPVEPIAIVLPRSSSLEGKVLDPLGVPAFRTTLSVTSEPLDGEPWHSDATSERSGRFRFSGVPPGKVTLVASTQGAARSERLEIDLAPGATLEALVLSLRRPASITGEVLAPAGSRMGRLELEGEGEVRYSDLSDGTFDFGDLPPGTFALRCGKLSNSFACSAEVVLAEGETRHVVLEAEGP